MDNTDLMVKSRVLVKDSAGTASSVFAGQAVGVVGVASGLIGLWAVACMVSAVVDGGLLAMISGWVSAVM